MRLIDSRIYHLRNAAEPEWEEFAAHKPDGSRLDLHFTAAANAAENTLLIRQDNVKFEWTVQLNGRKIGVLEPFEFPLVKAYAISPGGLKSGDNVLSVVPPADHEDILVGEVQLAPVASPELCSARLEIEVLDQETGQRLPCRITVVDKRGALAPVEAAAVLAARQGVIYTGNGRARFNVPPGQYRLYASRGFEYGIDERSVTLRGGEAQHLKMRIRHEVSTPGLVSCDTHIHTLTYSKHGDASIAERILTIAGEGIELPVSTEHNLAIDYSAAATSLGLRRWFTPVVGDEVTTSAGHFNIFPLSPGTVPDYQTEDWTKLLKSIRAMPGVQVAILNHPRDLHSGFRPFAPANFNPVTGENRRGPDFEFDGLELINSGALQSDWMQVYHDWFALLNHGYRIVGVGASDSHDVNRFLVGQARTYIACDDRKPSEINIIEACEHLRTGHALVSLGLLAEITVNGRFGPGDLATGLKDHLRVKIKIQGPSWSSADRVELFANGASLRSESIRARPGRIVKAELSWLFPRPAHDLYLVAVASGPGITEPFSPTPRPYQKTSRVWNPRTIGSTNPVWVDGDGDGAFTAPRDYAKALIQQWGCEAGRLLPALSTFDEAVASQAAGLCQTAGMNVRDPEYARALESAPPQVRRGFAVFISSLVD